MKQKLTRLVIVKAMLLTLVACTHPTFEGTYKEDYITGGALHYETQTPHPSYDYLRGFALNTSNEVVVHQGRIYLLDKTDGSIGVFDRGRIIIKEGNLGVCVRETPDGFQHFLPMYLDDRGDLWMGENRYFRISDESEDLSATVQGEGLPVLKMSPLPEGRRALRPDELKQLNQPTSQTP